MIHGMGISNATIGSGHIQIVTEDELWRLRGSDLYGLCDETGTKKGRIE